MTPLAIDWAARTDAGRKRENNEDAFAVCRLEAERVVNAEAKGSIPAPPVHGMLFSVADGVGGQSAGEVASALAVAGIAEELLRFPEAPEPLTSRECGSRLETAVRRTNGRIRQEAAANPERKDMAATLSCLWIVGHRGFFAQVGDSRIYRWRFGELLQLSHDQSEIGRAVRAGRISEADAKLTVGRNVLDQALGLRDETLQPEIDWIEVLPGDIYLLCSDGLVDRLHDSDVAECLAAALAHGESLDRAAEALMRKADESNSRDNVTVLLVRANGTKPEQTSAAVASAPLPAALETPASLKSEYKRWSGVVVILTALAAVAIGFAAGYFMGKQRAAADVEVSETPPALAVPSG